MREIAERTKMSKSKAYAIVNGDDNVEFETFENIATAFNMTPAELATMIGKGSPADDPAEAEVLARYRAVPPEKKPAAMDMLLGLAVQPTEHRGKAGRDDNTKRPARRPREVLSGTDSSVENEPRRRKGLFTRSSAFREQVLGSLLAVLGLNRDSGQFAPAA